MIQAMRSTRLLPGFLTLQALLLGPISHAQSESAVVSDVHVKTIVYKPPARGVPKGTVGGGTRGDAARESSISALAPGHVGLTLKEQPAIYWFAARPIDSIVEITVTDKRTVEPLLELRLIPPISDGMKRLHLADHGLRLATDVEYQWYVAVVRDPEQRFLDLVDSGRIRRTLPPPRLGRELSMSSPGARTALYAEAGIWYDALESISDLIDAQPASPVLHATRASLLEQVGLSSAAAYDRRAAGL